MARWLPDTHSLLSAFAAISDPSPPAASRATVCGWSQFRVAARTPRHLWVHESFASIEWRSAGGPGSTVAERAPDSYPARFQNANRTSVATALDRAGVRSGAKQRVSVR